MKPALARVCSDYHKYGPAVCDAKDGDVDNLEELEAKGASELHAEQEVEDED